MGASEDVKIETSLYYHILVDNGEHDDHISDTLVLNLRGKSMLIRKYQHSTFYILHSTFYILPTLFPISAPRPLPTGGGKERGRY